MAIRRFLSKRGAPDEFFSDNGTNFKGACNELARIDRECAEVVTTPSIKWTFIPPATPHMGGSWERMVRSVKEALKAFNDGRKLTDEILLTSLAEAEDAINTRPLVYLPQEAAEIEAITPNHFLRGTVKDADLKVDVSSDFAEALRDVYKRSQYLAEQMWQRWRKEYLPTINLRSKWVEDRKQLCVGDLVFIVNDGHRKNWTRGIVEEVFVGNDGRVRQRFLVNPEIPECEPEPELRAGVCGKPQGSLVTLTVYIIT
ncbi:uncharacterized protein LOC134291641 [Aedes albopictus]|uniref:Integrase catalytic domain-containing protein n=1 Tax=Aedes albopictus TaxID=7160 RepID=A0ABM1XZE0_AEDAL